MVYYLRQQVQERGSKMIVQVLDKFGKAIARKEVWSLQAMKSWLDYRFPTLDRMGYSVEILYTSSDSLI